VYEHPCNHIFVILPAGHAVVGQRRREDRRAIKLIRDMEYLSY